MMTILGLGVDIVKVARIEKAIERSGEHLAQRILSRKEMLQYQCCSRPGRFLARRFAAKEAAAKAFGTGIRGGLTFSQIEVYHDKLGKPYLRFLNDAEKIANDLGIRSVQVSLSDEDNYAIATVIIAD
jgi:holo-[acyl-carrier protein] synthase